jgi:hypothetical protein
VKIEESTIVVRKEGTTWKWNIVVASATVSVTAVSTNHSTSRMTRRATSIEKSWPTGANVSVMTISTNHSTLAS